MFKGVLKRAADQSVMRNESNCIFNAFMVQKSMSCMQKSKMRLEGEAHNRLIGSIHSLFHNIVTLAFFFMVVGARFFFVNMS